MNNELIRLRRYLHQRPEPAWLEIETTIFIIEYLKDLKFSYKYGKEICGDRLRPPSEELLTLAKEKNKHLLKEEYADIFAGYAGVVATLDTGKKGKHFLFRFDIDGLEVEESDDENHFPNKEAFVSQNIGYMHACGHDGHMAIGLAFAKWLNENIENLSGSYTIIFQPAEEGFGGAAALAQKIDFKLYDYFFSLHIGLGLPKGIMGVGTKNFYGIRHNIFEFFGESAHSGNKPEDGKNALLAACSAVLMIHSLPQYSAGTARVNVGKMNGGTMGNAVPDYAKILVESRSDKQEILDSLQERIKMLCENAAKCYETESKMKLICASDCYEEVDELFAEKINNIIKKEGIKTQLYPSFKASEDVTEFMNGVTKAGGKSIHFLVGCDLKGSHHSSTFDYEEDCLQMAYTSLLAVIKELQ